MAVPLQILVFFIISFIFSVVNCPSIDRNLTLPNNMSVPTVVVDENVVMNLLRNQRQVTRGNGCPIGQIFYFTGCRTFKELENDFISAKTKTSPYQTTKHKVLKNKHVEDTNVDLSIVPLVTPKKATTISTVFHESSSLATQQTTVETELNINVIPLKAVVKSKISNVGANPIPTKVPVKGSSSHAVTGPKLIVKSSNKESKMIVGTEPADATRTDVLVINTTTPTPSQVQQGPHVLESNPDLSVIPEAFFMKTNTTSSVSQSNVIRETKVKKLKNITELSNNAERVPSTEAGRTTFKEEPISFESKQKSTTTQAPLVADSNHIVFHSTTGADEVALGTVDMTSTSAVVDTKSTVTKIKEIVTSVNVEETYEMTESYPVPETTPLPTGTKITEEDNDSSTIVKSGRIPGSHLLNIFFCEFETLTGISTVVLLSIGAALLIYCIYVRKYKKSKKYQSDEEAVERKNKQIVISEVEN